MYMRKHVRRKKILILSPHLDDAVLDCCDHILSWKKAGHSISIVTVFTKFTNRYISQTARKYMQRSGFNNTKDFEAARKVEDVRAMKLLDVEWKHLNYVDGWYRIFKNAPIYNGEELFTGKISEVEFDLLEEIRNSLRVYHEYDHVCIPLGIGRHTDHVIVRNVAESMFNHRKIDFYADFPYAYQYKNWSFSALYKLLFLKRSFKKFSPWKRIVLDCYASQIPILFPWYPVNNKMYPEI